MNPGRQEKTRKNGRKPEQDRKRQYSSFYSIHPTREIKEAINSGVMELPEAMNALEERAEAGFKISLGYSDKNNSCFAIIREGGKDWDEARSAGAFHRDLAKAVMLLAHFLTVDGVAWPEDANPNLEHLFDW